MTTIHPSRKSSSSRAAFTLVELLVVIGIIALLISILLPALSKARKAANAVVCASGERQITLGMIMYANQYHGAIVGNAYTSGAFLQGSGYSDFNCPDICQMWDWQSPIAATIGLKLPPAAIGSNEAARLARFKFLTQFKGWICPENDILYDSNGALFPINNQTPMISYYTSIYFQYCYAPQAVSTNYTLTQYNVNTGSYYPNLSKVGDTSSKVWMTEGAGWVPRTTTTQIPPKYQLKYNDNDYYQSYADTGPFDVGTVAFIAPEMPLAMRHGARTVSPSINLNNSTPGVYSTYRVNVAFFDGHVETLDGLKAMNPNYWLPKNSILPKTECNATVNAFYLHGASSYIVP